MSDMDRAAQMALQANVKKSWRVKLRAFVNRWPDTISFIFAILAVAVLVALTSWEAHNSASGWALMAKGAAPPAMAYMAGFAITIGYVVFHRRAAEHRRHARALKKQPGKGDLQELTRNRASKSFVFAVFAAALSLFGVFSNLASKTAMSATGAEEANIARTSLVIEKRDLERALRFADVEGTQAIIDADKDTLASMLAEAKGWGMPDLEPDGACAKDLRPRQRQLCNRANGTAGEMGVRGEILINEAAMKKVEADTLRLAEVDGLLSQTTSSEGAAHWKAMSKISQDALKPDMFRIWGMFLASVFFLVIIGVGWDEFFERLEESEEPDKGAS